MGEVRVDFLDLYRKFFDKFTQSVDLSDQLPVKVGSYNFLIEAEIAGAVGDWVLQYLEQRKCPPALIAHLVRKVVEEVKVLCKVDPISCGYREESEDFQSLKLMQLGISKLVDVCSRYRDNAELSTLPAPHPLPPVTSCAIKNSRRSMEDRHIVVHDFHTLFNITSHGHASYYGVFDGHNGLDAAIYSVSHLHQYLAESIYYPNCPSVALREACIKTDELFSIKAQKENLHGGTTAVFALLRPDCRKLYVGWLGDSQAVLVRQGVPLQIVRPHKPDRSDEKERIEGMGGTVLYWGAWRVNGQLAVSRAIGDVEYKPYVTAEPDVEDISLNGTEDFLILACDGLWDFVSEAAATNAVYQQLQENPDDLEAVSHRLVALAKQQSSQDNISVVVVFLADPREVATRRLMETAAPNPFVAQNGSDLYRNGQHPHPAFDDNEDFGPETDVDMVDDVLLSPAIAAAKALVQQGGKAIEDDLERQRQQLRDFDDPADLDKSRDTPTPPAHEVAGNANADNLAESGGEESEEEWNYIPGKDPKPASADSEDQDDMSSQLNPNAAEFVPVSPTRLLLLDDAIISASPGVDFEKSLDNIELPTEQEFCQDIAQRPSDLGFTNGPKHGDDYFMRDNFSTLRNKSKDFNVSSTTGSNLADDSIISLNSSGNSVKACTFEKETIPFDKLEVVQNMEEVKTLTTLEKDTIFGTDNFSNSALGATNIFGKGDPMTTSMVGLKSFSLSPEAEENFSPKSTVVEAPVSPINVDDVLPINHQTDLDSPVDDFVINTQKTPELISPGDGPLDGLTSTQERTSSSGFDSESGAEEGETNVQEDSNEGFITEHRRSPPIDLSFKPIQNFSDSNPFEALQTPSATTPLDQFDEKSEICKASENKEAVMDSKLLHDDIEFLQYTPSSFISLRQSLPAEDMVTFDQLESPKDIPHFEPTPNSNGSLLATELPKLSAPEEVVEEKSDSLKQEPEFEETSFISDQTSPQNESILTKSISDLDTTEGFIVEESKILRDEKEFEQTSKLKDELKEGISELSLIKDAIPSIVNSQADEQIVSALDNIKTDSNIDSKQEPLNENTKESDCEDETKEMNLEFESNVADSVSSPDELKHLDDSFEVICKEELASDESLEPQVELKGKASSLPEINIGDINLPQESVELLSPTKQTNPFINNDSLTTTTLPLLEEMEKDKLTEAKTDLSSAIDDFSSALNEDIIKSEHSNLLTASLLEPEATKTVSYQTLTPADEPKLMKVETYVTGHEEEEPAELLTTVPDVIKTEESPVPEEEPIVEKIASPVETKPEVEPVLMKSEPVQSQVVTETLITALEETSEVPSVATTEVPSTAGTPPPTPAPGVESNDESQKTNILVAAVAAAVAAGSAIVAEKEVKKTVTAAKKTPVGGAKKPDVAAKATGKTVPAKPAPAKTATNTSKPASAATTKLTSTISQPKPAVAKAANGPTAIKKPTTAAPAPKLATNKPVAAAPAAKPVVGAVTKQVPKQLSVTKTGPTLKPSSKPTTPTSKPTTPTTPKSPGVMKSDAVKSPPRPTSRPATTTKPAGPTTKPAEKKLLTNGDVKPLAKKDDVSAKKPAATTTKPTPATRPTTAPPAKPSSTAKPAAAVTKTTTATKPATQTQPKPTKPASTTTAKTTVPPPIKRPTTAPAAKTTEKTSKETANKQISSAKSAVNGKTVPAKTTSNVKKTDVKANAKTTQGKAAPVKKPVDIVKEAKEEDKSEMIQEANVTTTNGFSEHIIENHETLNIEELAPVIVENVN